MSKLLASIYHFAINNIFLIVILFLLINFNNSAYSNTYTNPPDSLKQSITGTEFKTKICDIYLTDKTYFEDFRIIAFDDSTFTISNEHRDEIININKISKITFYRNGFLKGGLAALGGSLVFWIAYANAKDAPYAIYVAGALALPTFLAGGLIGNLIFHDYEYIFKGSDIQIRVKKLNKIIREHLDKE